MGICLLCGLISIIRLEGMEGAHLLLLAGCIMDLMGGLLDHVSGGHTLQMAEQQMAGAESW